MKTTPAPSLLLGKKDPVHVIVTEGASTESQSYSGFTKTPPTALLTRHVKVKRNLIIKLTKIHFFHSHADTSHLHKLPFKIMTRKCELSLKFMVSDPFLVLTTRHIIQVLKIIKTGSVPHWMMIREMARVQ